MTNLSMIQVVKLLGPNFGDHLYLGLRDEKSPGNIPGSVSTHTQKNDPNLYLIWAKSMENIMIIMIKK